MPHKNEFCNITKSKLIPDSSEAGTAGFSGVDVDVDVGVNVSVSVNVSVDVVVNVGVDVGTNRRPAAL